MIMSIKMTRYFLRYLILIITILTFSSSVTAEIKISQSISKSEIAFEDSAQFNILIEWEGSQSAYLFKKPLSPFIDRMKIGQFSSSVSSRIINGVETTQKNIIIHLSRHRQGWGLSTRFLLPI